MNVNRIVLLTGLLYALLPTRVFAQKQAYKWHFGDGRCLDFTSGAPVNVTGSQIYAPEGSASYCDKFGNLLFYTNGGGREPIAQQNEGKIWNRNNAIMYDMQGTQGGGWSAKQSSVIFEAPGQDSVYYVFTMDELEFNVGATPAILASQPNGRGLSYFKVDMHLNNGLGGVVQADQRVHVPSAEGLCAIRHANGRDYWVIINQDSTGFGIYSVTPSGVALSNVYPALVDQVFSNIKASPNGAYMAAIVGDFINVPLQTVVYRFNNATGLLSNPTALTLPTNPNSADSWEFSPNSRYLYAFQSSNSILSIDLVRYDLQAANIPGSLSLVGTVATQQTSSMQLAPDGKIYFVVGNYFSTDRTLGRINCPNTANASIELNLFTYNVGPQSFFFSGLPNYPAWLFENYDATYVELGFDTLRTCEVNGPITLNAQNPGATYLWSTGQTTQSITVSSPGTYSVRVTGPCGLGRDTVVVTDCVASTPCELFATNEELSICAGDTLQLQSNLSAFSNISQIKWLGGNGTFIPSDSVASPRYVPSASEITQGSVSLVLQVNATVNNGTSSGRLIAYDHSGNDLLFAISSVDGSIDSIQSNLGFDWLAMGFENNSSVLYGQSPFSGFTTLNSLNGSNSVINATPQGQIFSGEYDNVNNIFYVVGTNPDPNGNPSNQFLGTMNTTTGVLTTIGLLNLFTSYFFYYGDDDGINGLAYDPGQNVLYGIAHNGKLYRINPSTAVATFVGNSSPDLRGLAYDAAAGKLWGISENATLLEINKNTGAVVSIVNSQIPFSFITSLTYAGTAGTPVVCYDSLSVQIRQVPSVSISGPTNTCSRTNLPFTLTTNGTINSTAWNFGDAGSGSSNASTQQNPLHSFSGPGSYSVTVIANLQCLVDTLATTVNVLQIPNVAANSTQFAINLGDTVVLSASGATTYQWTPAIGLSCTACASPTANPAATTTYVLTGTNSAGCSASDSITIAVEIKCNELFLPDVFTPNGTGPGENEKLCIFGNCVRVFSLILYNRWGEEVFESTDLNSCWDGTFRGEPAPSGLYGYTMRVEKITGEIINKIGTITLLR